MRLDELYNNADNDRLLDLLQLAELDLLTDDQRRELTMLAGKPEAAAVLLMFHLEYKNISSFLVAPEQSAGKLRRLRVLRYSAVAAALLLTAGGSWLYLHRTPVVQQVVTARAHVYASDVLPGGNKAVLTLANGRTITLDNAANGKVTQQGGTQIVKLTDGSLAYQQGTRTTGVAAYNTISTPRSGQYMILLPDGSKVWLNSASSLRFPVAFTGSRRVVEIMGEAYFEIASDARKPFIVKTGQQQVHVLGTHFNISAYSEDSTVSTTLLEGAVRVTNGEETQYLYPGQQAKSNQQQITVNKKPDIDDVMAWKNGVFRFNESSIEGIMQQLARWYNVEVVYEKTSGRQPGTFMGNIPRNVPLSEVLHLLELTGHVQFSIENSSKIFVRY